MNPMFNMNNNINNNMHIQEIYALKNELQKYFEENKYLKLEIQYKIKEINNLKILNNDYIAQIQNLKKDINIKELKIINEDKEKINKLLELKNVINQKDEEIKNLKIEINQIKDKNIKKDEEIRKLKQDLQEKNNKDNTKMVDFNNIQIIEFKSKDEKLKKAIKCLSKEYFFEVENRLYKLFPEYKEMNNKFSLNGKPILRFKTIEENDIHDDDIIMFQPDE